MDATSACVVMIVFVARCALRSAIARTAARTAMMTAVQRARAPSTTCPCPSRAWISSIRSCAIRPGGSGMGGPYPSLAPGYRPDEVPRAAAAAAGAIAGAAIVIGRAILTDATAVLRALVALALLLQTTLKIKEPALVA